MRKVNNWKRIMAFGVCSAMFLASPVSVFADISKESAQEVTAKEGSTEWNGKFTVKDYIKNPNDTGAYLSFELGALEFDDSTSEVISDYWIPVDNGIHVYVNGIESGFSYNYDVCVFLPGNAHPAPGDYNITIKGNFKNSLSGAIDDITLNYTYTVDDQGNNDGDRPQGSVEWDGNYTVEDHLKNPDVSEGTLKFTFGEAKYDENYEVCSDFWMPVQNIKVYINGEEREWGYEFSYDSNFIRVILPDNNTSGIYNIVISGRFQNSLSNALDDITLDYTYGGETNYTPGWHTSEKGGWFWVEQDGTIKQSGWVEDKGHKYYIENGITVYNDWRLLDGKWRYFDKWGACMENGWAKIGKFFYHFNGDVMDANKWILTNGKWSYVDQYGHAYAGSPRWEKINGKYYAFDKWGNMYANTYVGKYYVNKWGAWDSRYDKK